MTEKYVRMSDVVQVLTNNRVHFGDMVKITSEIKALETLKAKPCEDCVSREAVMKLKSHKPEYGDMIYAFDVELLPSVAPKPLGSVLDKVRAEIEQEYNRLSATRADETLELGECLGLKMSLKIIDKYKEGEEGGT